MTRTGTGPGAGAVPTSPFSFPAETKDRSSAGNGDIRLSLLQPGRQVLTRFRYQYPLKLVSPDPHRVGGGGSDDNDDTRNKNKNKNKKKKEEEEEEEDGEAIDNEVTVVFLLTYGGGLVGGDKIKLDIDMDPDTKLVLATQGSTKLFKCVGSGSGSGSGRITSQQVLDVAIGAGAALCYLPDPTQPFAQSVYEQRQTFYVDPQGTSSLLVLDWVSEGRPARGESWQLWEWKGRNEVRFGDQSARLLLRDALTLNDDKLDEGRIGLAQKTESMGILGTLIIYGPVFAGLGDFFVKLMANQPRIGRKDFDVDHQLVGGKAQGRQRGSEEEEAGEEEVLWTAANVRGFVLVKFGAKSVEGARQWLGRLLRAEGTVERQFGHQALLCLR